MIVTNVGAIAALDAADGLPAWLRLYARSEQPAMRAMMGGMVRRLGIQMRTPRIFAASPAAIVEGRVFALPVDATHLLLLDEADGRVLKRIPLSSIGMVDTLLAVRGRQLVLAGERIATVLDWQAAGEDGSEQTDAINWTMDFPGAALRGRPFLTADSLFLATDDRLLRVDAEHWKIEQTMPRHPATWDSSQGPGNILVTGEHVVIATARQVNVYTNLAAITARYDRDIAADPTSPEPLVRYGELLFAAGQNDLALARFKAALGLATAPGARSSRENACFPPCSAVPSGSLRLMPQVPPHPRSSRSPAMPRSPRSTWPSIISPAPCSRCGPMIGATTLEHLQEILNDARQRNAIVRDTDQASRPAGQIARRTVAQVIDRYGIAIYQGVEQKLQQQLAAAQGVHDPAALIELFRRYPNSPSAPSALFAAGRLHEDQHKLTEAASTYRILIQEFPTHADAAVFVEAFARAYAAIPGKMHIAAARLAQASVVLNDPSTNGSIRLPDGRMIEPGPFSQVATALKQAAGIRAGQDLPDLRLPPAGTAAYVHARPLDIAADRILPTIPGCQTDYRRCVLVTPAQELLVLDAAGKTLSRTPAAELLTQGSQVDIAWASESILLVRSAGQLAGVDMATGKIAWTCVIDKLPSVEPIEDDAMAQAEDDAADGLEIDPRAAPAILRNRRWSSAPAAWSSRPGLPWLLLRPAQPAGDDGDDTITSLAIVSGRIVLGTNTGRMVALGAAGGEILWQLQLGQGSIGRVDATDEFAAAKLDATPARIVGVDMATGQSIFRRSYADDVIHNLVLGDDGRLFYTLQSRIACKDLFDQADRMVFTTRLESQIGFPASEWPRSTAADG